MRSAISVMFNVHMLDQVRRILVIFGNLKDASMSVNTVSALEKLVYMEGFHHRMSKFKEASLSMSSLLNLLHLSSATDRMLVLPASERG